MASSEWIRRSPRFDAWCSRRHGGCGDWISSRSETSMMLPKGTRRRFYWLCGKCAARLGIREVIQPIKPPPYDPSRDVKLRQLPPGDRE
jgi:hypothetical protein